MASVGVMRKPRMQSKSRQKPTRMPYSCQAQLGRSGSSGWPMGGGSTVRGIGRSMPQSSTFTMVHTAMRAPSGNLNGARSAIAEVGNALARQRPIAHRAPSIS